MSKLKAATTIILYINKGSHYFFHIFSSLFLFPKLQHYCFGSLSWFSKGVFRPEEPFYDSKNIVLRTLLFTESALQELELIVVLRTLFCATFFFAPTSEKVILHHKRNLE